jgi:monovalent cation:H+ antiporter-2, CPA2 family
MHAPAFLTELVIVFAVALGVVLVLSRLRFPTITGFIVAGALIGPKGLSLVGDRTRIEALAEIGVVLLLFTIGLEFSLARLRRLWRVLALGGGLQVGLTVGAVTLIAVAAMGRSVERGVFYGFLVALSSTAIVLRALAERRETDAPHGRLIVGALIFQDLCVVPMMVLIPMLAGKAGGAGAITLSLGKAAGVVLLSLLLGRLVIPPLLRMVAAVGRRELFLLAVLVLCTGIAWLTSLAGLSLALGAFLAGISLADSEYGHQALSEVLPFRETFTSLFFISVGMLFDPSILVEKPLVVGGLVLAVLAGKALLAIGPAVLMRFPLRVAVLSGIGLAQIGEFSFVLAELGRAYGLLSGDELRLFIAISVLTMVVTPLLSRLGPQLAAGASRLRKLEQLLGTSDDAEERSHAGLAGHVVIAGYGVAGKLLAEALRETGIRHLIVELNAETVRAARLAGEDVIYGDICSVEILEHLRVREASELVILINDPGAARRTVDSARRHAPDLPIRVRAHYVREIDELLQLGATDVVAEEFETGAEIMTRVLRGASVPRNIIEERVAHARHAGHGLERSVTVARRMLGEIGELRGLKIETFLVKEEHWVHGRTVGDFHAVAPDVLIVALGREGRAIAAQAQGQVGPGDVVYLVGDRVDVALALLAGGPPGEEKPPP